MLAFVLLWMFACGCVMGWCGRQLIRTTRSILRLERERDLFDKWDREDAATIQELNERRREWLNAVAREHELYDQALGKREVH